MAALECACGRKFEVSEIYKKMVLAGKIKQAECPYCDGSHNDGANDETEKV